MLGWGGEVFAWCSERRSYLTFPAMVVIYPQGSDLSTPGNEPQARNQSAKGRFYTSGRVQIKLSPDHCAIHKNPVTN